jgi:hypothetical protein
LSGSLRQSDYDFYAEVAATTTARDPCVIGDFLICRDNSGLARKAMSISSNDIIFDAGSIELRKSVASSTTDVR